MSAGTYNDTIEQGAVWTRALTYTDDAGDAVDLTGYDARMQIRRRKESADVIQQLDIGSGITIATPASGIIELQLTATETAALTFSTAHYDLELYPGGDADAADPDTIRLLEGTLTLSAEVTR